MAALLAEKLLDLLARIGDLLEADVDCVQQQDDLDRRVIRVHSSVESMKGKNLALLIVVKQCEVLQFETRYRLSRLICDHNTEPNASLAALGRGRERETRRGCRGLGRRCRRGALLRT